MGTPDPSKRRYRPPRVQHGLNTPQQSMDSFGSRGSGYSHPGLSPTPTDSNMSAMVQYFPDSRMTGDPREEGLSMSSPTPMTPTQPYGTPAQPSSTTSYDTYTDVELARQERIERIRAARAKTALLEADIAQKIARKGHRYGKVTVNDDSTAVLGDAFDRDAHTNFQNAHDYGETQLNGRGFANIGDVSLGALSALMRDRRSPPVAAIDPK